MENDSYWQKCLDITFLKPPNLTEPEPAMTPTEIIFLFGIPSCLGCLFNLAILCVVYTCHRKHTKPFMFLLSMCVSDLLMSLFGGPLFINQSLSFLYFQQFGAAICRITNFVQALVLGVLALSMMAVSIERYVVICHPLKAKISWTRRRCRAIIAGIWILAIFMAAFDASLVQFDCFVTDWIAPGQPQVTSICSSKAGWEWVLPVARLVLLLIVPFLVMAFCYASVARVLWNTDQNPATPKLERQTTFDRIFNDKRSLIHRATSLSISSLLGAVHKPNIGGSLMSVFSSSPPSSPHPDKIGRSNRGASSATLCKHMKDAAAVNRTRKRWIRMLCFVLVLFTLCYCPKLAFDLNQTVKAMRRPEVHGLNQNFSHFVPTNKTAKEKDFDFDPGNFTMPENGKNDDGRADSILSNLFNWLVIVHSTLNPILYVCLSQGIRDAFFCRTRKRAREAKRERFQRMNTFQRMTSQLPLEEVTEEKF